MIKRAIEWFKRTFWKAYWDALWDHERYIDKRNKPAKNVFTGIDLGVGDKSSCMTAWYTNDGAVYHQEAGECMACGDSLSDYTEMCEALCRKCRKDHYIYKIENIK